jgi:hypothetical protein
MPIKEFEPFTDIPESELLEYISDLTSEPGIVIVRQFKQPNGLWTVIAGRIVEHSATSGGGSGTSGGADTGGAGSRDESGSAIGASPVSSPTIDGSGLFQRLIDAYARIDIAAPALKSASLAQWMLESGRGSSALAQQYFNFAGLKFRERMTVSHGFDPPAEPVDYHANDGRDTYCKFQSLDHFVKGYWHFIDSGPYTDWKTFAEDPLGYVGYLKQKGYAADPIYVTKVAQLIPIAAEALKEAADRIGVGLPGNGLASPVALGRVTVKIPKAWMPSCVMARIICHWTAGKYNASADDKYHYHILIEEDGKLVRGVHSIRDNVSTADHKYAAHTRGANTGSIGVSVCCMSGAEERPFKPGSYPMTKRQWEVMIAVVAELCRNYGIEPLPHTVLGHGEVQKTLGATQKGKWDPMKLPWEPNLTSTEVGNLLRNSVRALL